MSFVPVSSYSLAWWIELHEVQTMGDAPLGVAARAAGPSSNWWAR